MAALPRPSSNPRCSARSRPELASERGLEHLGWATIVTARERDRGAGARHRTRPQPSPSTAGASTRSVSPTTGDANGYSVGDAANELAHLSLDPNVHIQEVKAHDVRCPCRADDRAARRWARAGARLPAARRHHVRHRPRGLTVEPPALRLDRVARVPGGLTPGLEDGEAGARRTGEQRQAGRSARAAGGVVRPRARRPPRPAAAPTTPGGSGLPSPCGRRHRPTPSGAPSARSSATSAPTRDDGEPTHRRLLPPRCQQERRPAADTPAEAANTKGISRCPSCHAGIAVSPTSAAVYDASGERARRRRRS